MKLARKVGSTSQILQVFIQDSSSTTGAGLTGLLFNSGSLTAYYHRDTGTTATAITLVTMTVGTFTPSGFKEIDATNMPGWYQLCPPDAVFATGAKSAAIHLKGAASMAPLPIEVDLAATSASLVADVWDEVNTGATHAVASSTGLQLRSVSANTGVIYTATAPSQAGMTSTQIKLDSGASAVDNVYQWDVISITSGTNAGDSSIITGYVGATKVATVNNAWAVQPDATSVFAITPTAQVQVVSYIAGQNPATLVWQDTTAGDFTVSSSIGKSLYTSGVVPGGSGGLLISGSNTGTTTLAALTVSGATTLTGNVSMAAGLNVTQSSSNTSALIVTGNGTGHGAVFSSGSGATGNGFVSRSLATDGHGVSIAGAGTGNGTRVVGGATGAGVAMVGGATSGAGISVTTTSGDGLSIVPTAGNAITATANGTSKHGFVITGGTAGTSDGIKAVAGTGGIAIRGDNNTTIAAAVWDEVNTAALHNITNSAGAQLRAISTNTGVIYTATAPSQAGMTSTQIKLDSGASAVDNVYQWDVISITSGTDAGDSAIITGYVGSTRVATVNKAWQVQPDATSIFQITPTAQVQVVSYIAGQDPATLVLDVAAASHNTALTIGAKINTSASASDPWSTAIPGAYSSGTAGNILGNRLDAAVTSRLAPTVAARTLDVSAGGEAGLDWANIGSPTTLVNLTGTTVAATRTGTAQAANFFNITLDSGASAVNGFYTGQLVLITGGTGAGQCRTVTDYAGSLKIANVDRSWFTNPDNTSTFAVLPASNPAVNALLQVTAGPNTVIIRASTAQAGTTNTVTLDASASAVDNLYAGALIQITGGTGLGQVRTVVSYVGSTKVASVDRNWVTNPDNTSTFNIVADSTPSTFSQQGVAQASTSSTLTLSATASSTSGLYVGSILTILSGTGSGQTGAITAYNGSTKVATVTPNWGVNPDTTSAYAVIPTVASSASVVPDPLASAVPGSYATGTAGKVLGSYPANFSSLGIDTNGNVKIQGQVKKNAALAKFPIKMVLTVDHVSAATGKSITVQRSLDGAAFANANAVTATEIANGWYYIDLIASDLNANTVIIRATGIACDPTEITLVTQP